MKQRYEEKRQGKVVSFKEFLRNLYGYRTLGAAFFLIFFVSAFSGITEGQGRKIVLDNEQARPVVSYEKSIRQEITTEKQFEQEKKEMSTIENIQTEKATEETENLKKRESTEQETSKKGKKINQKKERYVCAYPDITREDYECLARIVMAEAGNQGEKGMILVANVVLNRMQKFQMTIPQVVFQAGQFMPTWDGAYESVVVSDIARSAAKKALNGVDYSHGAMYFCTKKAVNTFFRTKLTFLFQYKDHLFYR